METYVAPEIKMESVKFFEKIACSDNKCWTSTTVNFSYGKYHKDINVHCGAGSGCTQSNLNSFLNQVDDLIIPRVDNDGLFRRYKRKAGICPGNDYANAHLTGINLKCAQ